MVRIKAETTAAIALAPSQNYRPPQLDQCNNYYGFYSPATTYQQSCPTHAPTQQLNEVLGEVWTVAASGYQDWAEVSLLKMNLYLEKLIMALNFISVLNRLVFLFLFISCDLWMSLVLTCRLMCVRSSLAPSLIKRLLFSSSASSTDEPLHGWLHSSFCFQTVPPTQPQVAPFYPLMSSHFMMSISVKTDCLFLQERLELVKLWPLAVPAACLLPLIRAAIWLFLFSHMARSRTVAGKGAPSE